VRTSKETAARPYGSPRLGRRTRSVRHDCVRPGAPECSPTRPSRSAGHGHFRRHHHHVGNSFGDRRLMLPVGTRYSSARASRRCRFAVRRRRCNSLPPLALGSRPERCARNRRVELDTRRLLRLGKRDRLLGPRHCGCRIAGAHRRRGRITGTRRQGKATPMAHTPAPAMTLPLHINATRCAVNPPIAARTRSAKRSETCFRA
jgi:hypothetical protein